VQHAVLEDLHAAPMRTGPCESPMIFTPAPMIDPAPITTSPVIPHC